MDLEHLECSYQPHIQGQGAKKEAHPAGRTIGIGCGLGGPASSTFSIFDLRRLASSSSGSVTSAATSTNSSPTATCDFPGGLSTYIEGLRGSPRGDKSPSTPAVVVVGEQSSSL